MVFVSSLSNALAPTTETRAADIFRNAMLGVIRLLLVFKQDTLLAPGPVLLPDLDQVELLLLGQASLTCLKCRNTLSPDGGVSLAQVAKGRFVLTSPKKTPIQETVIVSFTERHD